MFSLIILQDPSVSPAEPPDTQDRIPTLHKMQVCPSHDGLRYLERLGYQGDDHGKSGQIKAAFEAHIEQGPILEVEAKQIGVVTGVQGLRWYDLGTGNLW